MDYQHNHQSLQNHAGHCNEKNFTRNEVAAWAGLASKKLLISWVSFTLPGHPLIKCEAQAIRLVMGN